MKSFPLFLFLFSLNTLSAKFINTYEIIYSPYQPAYIPDVHVFLSANDSILVGQITTDLSNLSFNHNPVIWTLDSFPVDSAPTIQRIFRTPGIIGYIYSGQYYKCFTLDMGCSNGVLPGEPQVTANFDSLCKGQNLSLSTSVSGNATSWFWSGPAGFTSTLQNPFQNNIQVTQSGKWYVVATNACGSLASSINIEVADTLHISLYVNSVNNVFCLGSQVNLHASFSHWHENIFWTGPNGFYSLNNFSPNFIALDSSQSGIYTFTAENACGIFDTSIYITISNPLITSPIFQSGNEIIVPHNNSSDSITWFYNNTQLSFTGDSIFCLGDGSYYCTVSNSLGCLETSDSIPVQCSSLGQSDLEKSDQFFISSNPVEDLLLIRSSIPVKSFAIFDIQGRKYIDRNYFDNNVSEIYEDLTKLKPGMYLLTLNMKDSLHTKRIIKN
jgi:hypothetical protein